MSAPIVFWDPQTAVDNDGAPMFNGSGPLYSANPWDVVVIGGQPIPGICKVHCGKVGNRPKQKVDKKRSAGRDGEALTLTGYKPASVEIEVVLWTQEQWRKFQTLAGVIWRKPGKRLKGAAQAQAAQQAHARALAVAASAGAVTTASVTAADAAGAVTIDHPALQLWAISSVVIVSVGVPEIGPIPQSRLIKIECYEWVPPQPRDVTKTVRAATPVPEDPRTAASAALGEDPPSVTDLGPDGPGQSTIPGR